MLSRSTNTELQRVPQGLIGVGAHVYICVACHAVSQLLRTYVMLKIPKKQPASIIAASQGTVARCSVRVVIPDGRAWEYLIEERVNSSGVDYHSHHRVAAFFVRVFTP